MTAIITQLTGVAAATDLGPVEMPAKELCIAYHIFGGTQAASVANRLDPASPLSVTGAPTYEDDCAILSPTAGFVRPSNSSAYDRTVFIVFADPFIAPATPPAVPTETLVSAQAPVVWWASQSNGLYLFGNSWKFRPRTDGGASDCDTGAYNSSQDRPWYYPDGTSRRGGFRMAVTRQREADATLWMQNGSILEQIGPVARDDTGSADKPTHIGGPWAGVDANSLLRVAAYAEFTALDDDQVAAVASFIASELEARAGATVGEPPLYGSTVSGAIDIDGAGSAPGYPTPQIVGMSAVAVSHTGDTTETTMATIPIPAGSVGANGQIEIEALFSNNSSANSKTVRTRFGGVAINSGGFTTTLSAMGLTRICNRGAASSQVATGSFRGIDVTASPVSTTSIDTTVDQNITITGQLGVAADTITLESYIVKVVSKA